MFSNTILKIIEQNCLLFSLTRTIWFWVLLGLDFNSDISFHSCIMLGCVNANDVDIVVYMFI